MRLVRPGDSICYHNCPYTHSYYLCNNHSTAKFSFTCSPPLHVATNMTQDVVTCFLGGVDIILSFNV